ncbi:peptide permease [bacterium]|nr:peptide permease [Actinomycetota bacterium]MBE33838.1 peptide permease [bacterium]|tara:strand:- start:3533 stop:4507 length:975 start_codon:yes stop_codon:yes gene_type:complete
MIRYISQRLLALLPMLLGVTFIAFIIMKAAPGDPVGMFMDPSVNLEDIDRIRSNLGFDKPILIQYLMWLKNVLMGNFGYSLISGKPALQAILERLPATLLLSVSSLCLILLITFPLGILCGYKKDTPIDDGITVFSFLGLSMPSFWLGLMLILLFSYQLDLFPTSGFMNPLLYGEPFYKKAGNILYHMCLPLLTIMIGGIAGLTRYNRFGIIKILGQDYITAARARGVSESRILFKHAFKNILLPIITLLGLDLPGLISGSYIIEFIFSWPGMGQLAIQSVFQRDYPILMAVILLSSILIIIGTLIADICYAYIDPRITKKGKS